MTAVADIDVAYRVEEDLCGANHRSILIFQVGACHFNFSGLPVQVKNDKLCRFIFISGNIERNGVRKAAGERQIAKYFVTGTHRSYGDRGIFPAFFHIP